MAWRKYPDYVDITFYILCNAIRNLIDNMEDFFMQIRHFLHPTRRESISIESTCSMSHLLSVGLTIKYERKFFKNNTLRTVSKQRQYYYEKIKSTKVK